MLNALSAISRYMSGDNKILKHETWLRLLALTSERAINLERVHSLDEVKHNYVLAYVKKTLELLSGWELADTQHYLLEETLKWSEVSKAGLPHQRKAWLERGMNLFAHNVGSAQIYWEHSVNEQPDLRKIIHTLILTHGLIGQTIRGEVSFEENKPLFELVRDNLLSPEELVIILSALNASVVGAVGEGIWESIQDEACAFIRAAAYGLFEEKKLSLEDRIKRLRAVSIKNGENVEGEYPKLLESRIVKQRIEAILEQCSLWYVEAALYDFSFEEFIKIFLIIAANTDSSVKHISFEAMMRELYYQHEGRKRINIYKKRIIEKYLSCMTVEAITSQAFPENIHVKHAVLRPMEDTAFFTFSFSPAGRALIDFCTEAEKSDVLYENAIILLFDLFGLRRDAYDRFYEEERYLKTMNQSIDYKRIILDYIVGQRIVDIGPGGGAMMDLIVESFPDKQVMGVDIAQNVLDALRKKKQLENRAWDVCYGDALDLSRTIETGSVDTIIFCSILHELFSYIEFEGRKFNHDVLKTALRSAFDILPKGGRIIIRDGVMTEPENENRIIKFLSEEGMAFLDRYTHDFKGREITYSLIGHNEVMMTVNDAMEFLYTYTWGEKSYVHEVNEQFGYLTPSGFKSLIGELFGAQARIVELKHFLQDGYTLALSQKIEFYDENRVSVRLPDSTCLVVIEKN